MQNYVIGYLLVIQPALVGAHLIEEAPGTMDRYQAQSRVDPAVPS